MVKTQSTMKGLGTTLPFFDLPVVNKALGKMELDAPTNVCERLNSDFFNKKPLLIMFLCAHCPFVKHVENEITNLQNDYSAFIDLLAISSNSLITHPQDGPVYLAKQAKENCWDFPYLFDSEQSFAKALEASCTPDFFFFVPSSNGNQELFYRGQLDESRPTNGKPVNGFDLRQAIDSHLKSIPIPIEQKPSIGCNIKWHPGKEPNWFA